MSSVCDVCAKKPIFGMSLSHSHRRTKRRWNPNIQRVRAIVNGAPKRVNDKDLGELWISCGLWKVRTTSLELTMEFSSFDDFWLPFLGGATPTSAFAATLNRETGGTVAEVLRDKMPTLRRDGSFALPARAWAVAGIASH